MEFQKIRQNSNEENKDDNMPNPYELISLESENYRNSVLELDDTNYELNDDEDLEETISDKDEAQETDVVDSDLFFEYELVNGYSHGEKDSDDRVFMDTSSENNSILDYDDCPVFKKESKHDDNSCDDYTPDSGYSDDENAV